MIRLAGAAVLVAAALFGGGCGRASALNPEVLAEFPDYTNYGPLDGANAVMVAIHSREKMMLRILAYNTGTTDLVLDRIELVNAKGVVLHDAWTIDPKRLMSLSSEWADAKEGWHRDPGARDFASTILDAANGKHYTLLTVEVSITGKAGDDTTHRMAAHVGGLRVKWHVGNRSSETVLPVGFSGCFSTNFKPPLCREQQPIEVLNELGLSHT